MVFPKLTARCDSLSILSGPSGPNGFAALRWRGVMDRLGAVDRGLLALVRLGRRTRLGLSAALERARLRRLALRDLRGLDDHLLADIGLSRPMLCPMAQRLADQRLERRCDGEETEHGLTTEPAIAAGAPDAVRSALAPAQLVAAAAVQRQSPMRSGCRRRPAARRVMPQSRAEGPQPCCCPAA